MKDPISEQSIIEAAVATASKLPEGIGIGDDCACLPWDHENYQIVTSDSLIESIHFTKDIDPEDLGFKSLAVNLSDIAAMGGVPLFTLLNLSVPSTMNAEWIERFMRGFSSLANRYQVTLVGGDTTRSPDCIAICVTVLGKVSRAKIKLRSGAKIGDVLAVTGRLGDSRAGLRCLLSGEPSSELVRAHCLPEPQIEAGILLADFPAVHAMMDLSDGLTTDLPRLTKASGIGAKIDLACLPVSDELARWASQNNIDPQDFAAAGGEDYQLLCSMSALAFIDIARCLEGHGILLTKIGIVTEDNAISFERHGKSVNIKACAFSHF